MIPKKSYINGKGEHQNEYNYYTKFNNLSPHYSPKKFTDPNIVFFHFIEDTYTYFHRYKTLTIFNIQDITSFLDNYEEYKFYQETSAIKYYSLAEIEEIGKNHKYVMNMIFDFLKELDPIIHQINNSIELMSRPTTIAELCDGNRNYIRNHRKIMSMIYNTFETKISASLQSIKSNHGMRIDLSKVNVYKQRSSSPLSSEHSPSDFIIYRNGTRRKSTPMILGATFKKEIVETPRST